jgi:Uma2 family endonuclease
MATATLTKAAKVWTDEALAALPNNGYKHELLDGELITSPVHEHHGGICIQLAILIGTFVRNHDLGRVYDSSTGFRLADKLLLSPDVSFVRKARLKKLAVAPDQFLQGAPDLVVEVLSPGDRMTQVNRKLDHYFEHGTRVAWLVNGRKRQVHIYTPDSIEALTRPNDRLTGGDVLPGFKCRLSRIFDV